MKTYKKTLLYKEYTFKGGYWSQPNKGKSYLKLELVFDFKEGLRFVVGVPNMSCCQRNPFKAFARVLEHENVKGMKYDDLKENMRRKGLQKQL